jgi:hypothetical protein
VRERLGSKVSVGKTVGLKVEMRADGTEELLLAVTTVGVGTVGGVVSAGFGTLGITAVLDGGIGWLLLLLPLLLTELLLGR